MATPLRSGAVTDASCEAGVGEAELRPRPVVPTFALHGRDRPPVGRSFAAGVHGPVRDPLQCSC